MMKKVLICFLCLLLCVGAAACGDGKENPADKSEVSGKEHKEQKPVYIETGDKDKDKAAPDGEGPKKEEQKIPETVKIYYFDDQLMNRLTTDVKCNPVTEKAVWDLLKEKEVISPECELLSFKKDGTKAVMDLNQKFQEYIRTMGTSGETMIIGSIVNTYLDAFGCDGIKLTADGEVLTTGHEIYDRYLEKYE